MVSVTEQARRQLISRHQHDPLLSAADFGDKCANSNKKTTATLYTAWL